VVDEQDPLDQPGDAPGVAAGQAVRGVPFGQEGRQVGGLEPGGAATSTGPMRKAPQTEAYTSSEVVFRSSAAAPARCCHRAQARSKPARVKMELEGDS
jgi:hypothetical protein